ncbi:MAG TPA: lipid II flippase MurJ [Motilibacteraceae bacterium]|nr:lipid II flippase MurJ [Motilibacteraceae bacterium]
MRPRLTSTLTGTLAGGAALIAVVTLLSRVVGFGRWVVFSGTVEDSCLGTAYTTANMLPNILFEVVAGGALASAVVPLVAAPLARGDAEQARRTASALLTWAVAALLPVAVVGVLLAGPLMTALVRHPAGCSAADVAGVAAAMFVLLVPQVVLYGVAVVAAGVLNARRRFLAPALAPLLSSLVVAAAYVAFDAGYDGSLTDLAGFPERSVLVLGLGTTAGVVVLAATSLLPVLRTERLRPTFAFPPGVAPRARGLAAAGLAGLVAQQLATLVVIVVTNRSGGALTVYNYAWAVYLLPYAVLAVPIATASFTALAEHLGRDDDEAYARTAAATTRAVVVAGTLGAAVLAGAALPVARTFGVQPPARMAWALVALAPGLVGYGLVAHLGRALYARGEGRAAATATVVGWVVAGAGAAVVASLVAATWVVVAAGAAISAGMTVSAVMLLAAVRRAAGRPALEGVPRAVLAGAAGAVVGAAVGAAVSAVLPAAGRVGSALEAALAAAVAGGVFAAGLLVLDGGDLRAALRRLPGAGQGAAS